MGTRSERRLDGRIREWPRARGGVRWDGRDTQGRTVPSGIYFLEILRGDDRAVEKIIRLR
jgi:hypothetical protein